MTNLLPFYTSSLKTLLERLNLVLARAFRMVKSELTSIENVSTNAPLRETVDYL